MKGRRDWRCRGGEKRSEGEWRGGEKQGKGKGKERRWGAHLGNPKILTAPSMYVFETGSAKIVGNPGGAAVPTDVPGTSAGPKPGWSGRSGGGREDGVARECEWCTEGKREGHVEAQKDASVDSAS